MLSLESLPVIEYLLGRLEVVHYIPRHTKGPRGYPRRPMPGYKLAKSRVRAYAGLLLYEQAVV